MKSLYTTQIVPLFDRQDNFFYALPRMKRLVIVESPTKAKTISKFLGSGFTVESSFGHVRDLPKSNMGVDIEDGTFLPQYVTARDKSAHIKKLKDLAKKSDEVIFATDEDREGEAISWHLAHILSIAPESAKRIVFHEITKGAIEAALSHPRGIDQKLVDAQQARRVLDRLVGYELSPFLWKKVARGLSAGRVQSVAVRLVVEREREREAFVAQDYWTITGEFTPKEKEHLFAAHLYSVDDKKLDKLAIDSQEKADEIVTQCFGAAFSIASLTQKEAKRTPPPPFTTSTLQQSANNKLGYSSKQTMRLAQQLYEGIDIGVEGSVGLVTYMRTDSVNLSDAFLKETHAFVEKTYGPNYLLAAPRRYKTKSKGAQEAHEAVRPTDPNRTPESVKSFLSAQQFNLYSLIWKRAVAIQMQDARLNRTTIDIAVAPAQAAPKYIFRATGQTMLFDGWLALYPNAVKEEMLPELMEGHALVCKKLTNEKHTTEPPARYSDATLVKALEEYGIGRPSTYAPTLATIEARGYVERDENKRLKPMDIALLVTDLLVNHFSEIIDYQFTAQMEENLDAVAEGTREWQPLISEFYRPFHDNLEKKTDELSKQEIAEMKELGTDTETGKKIFVRIGRYGPFVQRGQAEDEDKPVFASIPKGKNMNEVTLEDALQYLSLPKTLSTDDEGNDIEVNVGRFGPYVKYKGKYYSIKTDDPYTLTLPRAKEIIKEKEEADAKALIKTFPEDNIVVKIGRYGPYITDGKTNARVPKDTDPATLDLAACIALLEEAKKKPKRGRRRGAPKKKTD